MLYSDPQSRRQLARERVAQLAADYGRARRPPSSDSATPPARRVLSLLRVRQRDSAYRSPAYRA